TRGLPRQPAGAWLPESPAAPPLDAEHRRPPAGDERLARARHEPVALLPAAEPAAPLGGDRRQYAVPGAPSRLGRGAHARPREDGLRQVGPARAPRRPVPPLPRGAGVRLRRRVFAVGARPRGGRPAL